MKNPLDPIDVMMWTLVTTFAVLSATCVLALLVELWRYAR